MTEQEQTEVEQDMPVVNLRNTILDTLDAHRGGFRFEPEFIENARDQLTAIYEDITRGKAA